MADLLPCPFCASDEVYTNDGFVVHCDNCEITIWASVWNRRAPAGVPREPTEASELLRAAEHGMSVLVTTDEHGRYYLIDDECPDCRRAFDYLRSIGKLKDAARKEGK